MEVVHMGLKTGLPTTFGNIAGDNAPNDNGGGDNAGVDNGGGESAAGMDGSDFGVGISTTTVGATVLTQVLFLQEPGDGTTISVDDIHQGQIADCFLLSAIGEIALTSPTSITKMIHVNANGTETVTLHTAANGTLPTFGTTAFKATTETVTNVFPTDAVNSGTGQDVVGDMQEIWPQVLEKAVATLDGGYTAIADGGNPVIAMEQLTGHAAAWYPPASLTAQSLQSFAAAGDLIVMDTSALGDLPYGLVSDHAYMFDKITGSGAGAMVTLLNPWGVDEPSAIPLAALAKGIVEVDVGHA